MKALLAPEADAAGPAVDTALEFASGGLQAGEAEDRLVPLLPKLQRDSMSAANGEAAASSGGSGGWQPVQ
jgi:hypothetical protein